MNTSIETSSEFHPRIIILMACHNRELKTKEFFERFVDATRDHFRFEFLVTDDGSIDDTKRILECQPFPMKISQGDGTLFWAKSMAKAEENIVGFFDGVLWMNDDLKLSPNAFDQLKEGMIAHPRSVLVGQVQDEETGKILFGGYRRANRNPLSVRRVSNCEPYSTVDTFNGNFVYIPFQVRASVGPIDSYFDHAYADIDYGYRVVNCGFTNRVLPRVIGTDISTVSRYPNGYVARLRMMLSKKNLPIRSQMYFFLKHTYGLNKLLIPLFLTLPFLRIVFLNKSDTKS